MKRKASGNGAAHSGSNRFGGEELAEALRQVESMLRKLRGVVRTLDARGSDGSRKAQITLAKRRVAALEIASELMGRELEGGRGRNGAEPQAGKRVVDGILRELRAAGSAEKREVLSRFFKTGLGEYGEGDRFLGVMVPQIRAIAGAHLAESGEGVERALLASPWHEVRECGLFLMTGRFRKGGEAERGAIHRAYLAALAEGRVNNWDLVDGSAPTLLGEWLLGRDRGVLDELAGRPGLWENRAAVVGTLGFVRRGDLADAFRQCERALGHRHDLMHKAVGWVLRECGKKDAGRLREFLVRHAGSMPRTALRYAIERFSAEERRAWLGSGK